MNNYKMKLRKPIPFTMSSKRIKYLGISLIKKIQDLDTENYRTSLKSQWQDIGANL